jgi:hypothetical protein
MNNDKISGTYLYVENLCNFLGSSVTSEVFHRGYPHLACQMLILYPRYFTITVYCDTVFSAILFSEVLEQIIGVLLNLIFSPFIQRILYYKTRRLNLIKMALLTA